MKIQLLRNVDVDGREFINGQVLTDKDITKGEMMSLVSTEWAIEVTGKAKSVTKEPTQVLDEGNTTSNKTLDEGSRGNSESNGPGPVGELIASMGFSKTAVAALKKVGIETLEQAKDYMAEHGSLEPIRGVSKEVADKLASY